MGKGPALEQTKTPSLIPPTLFGRNEFDPEVKVTSIKAGVHAQAAVNSRGQLFTWGKNRGSCLGLANKLDQFFPLRVSLTNDVTDLSIGVDHMSALAKPVL